MLNELLSNRVLAPALVAWALAQIIKVPLELVMHGRMNWAILFSPGGMPSSHAALVTAAIIAIGVETGWDSPAFALAVVLGMVVLYDATGIRRQAGKQARVINQMMEDLAKGHPLQGEQLKEVLGHTPLEVAGGLVFGAVVALLMLGASD